MAIQTIAVIGAGTMGRGITQVAALTGITVIMLDVDDTALQRALEAISSGLERLVKKDKLTSAQKQTALGLIKPTSTYERHCGR